MLDLRATDRERAHQLLKRWLKRLPADGWTGTSKEAADALYRVKRFPEPVPLNGGLFLAEHEPYIRSLGWRLTFGRTMAARWIRLERAKRTAPARSRASRTSPA
jgi:hypothetical protein